MMIASNREVRFQLEQLTRANGALKLSEWEEKFIENINSIPFERLSENQKQTVTKIYHDRKDSNA